MYKSKRMRYLGRIPGLEIGAEIADFSVDFFGGALVVELDEVFEELVVG